MEEMMTTKLYSIFLLTAFTTLAGCQTAALLPSQDIIQDESTMTMQADVLDSDGDGVPDDIDECPATPKNIIVDEQGCPPSLELNDENYIKKEVRVHYDENSSEIDSKYFEELDKAGVIMQKRLDTVIDIEAHISTREENKGYQTLSSNRTEWFKNFLISKYQIDCSRIKTYGYGAEQPIAPPDTEETDQYNRRLYGVIANPEYDNERFNNSKGKSCEIF